MSYAGPLINGVTNSNVSSLYSNPVVSMVSTLANSNAPIVADHRTSSIAALRMKAREHSVALGTI
jgi:hypothetical protein